MLDWLQNALSSLVECLDISKECQKHSKDNRSEDDIENDAANKHTTIPIFWKSF